MGYFNRLVNFSSKNVIILKDPGRPRRRWLDCLMYEGGKS
jgi:hypothetical protein